MLTAVRASRFDVRQVIYIVDTMIPNIIFGKNCIFNEVWRMSDFTANHPLLQPVYPRERLYARLDRSLERQLVWITAPGGAGKSTLVAHYLELRDLPAIWCRVDSSGTAGATLFHNFTHVVESIAPSLAPSSALLNTPEVSAPGTRIKGWFRAFFTNCPPSTTLVFDVHTAPDADDFQLHLACCLEELPGTCRVIVLCRDGLPPGLSRFRHQELMHDLTGDDLRITLEEAVGIAGFVLSKAVETHAIMHLHARTNGWMAGFILCLRHGMSAPEFLLPAPVRVSVPAAASRSLVINTLGRFEIAKDGARIEFSGKAPKKPLDLLKMLLINGGRNMTADSLAETLWPDASGDAAADSLTTSIQRLRHLLGSESVIRVKLREVGLDRRVVRVDAWDFEKSLRHSREALCQGDEARAEQLNRYAQTLYQGHFLPCDSDKSWSFAYRERLRGKFLRLAGSLCRKLIEQGDTRQAIACYQDSLEIDHLAEEFYQQLMHCYYRAGFHAEAAVVYQTCRKNLALNLGIAPSPRTEEIFRMIRNHKGP
jgi:DNA-binding SARP family transcriptional activator